MPGDKCRAITEHAPGTPLYDNMPQLSTIFPVQKRLYCVPPLAYPALTPHLFQLFLFSSLLLCQQVCAFGLDSAYAHVCVSVCVCVCVCAGVSEGVCVCGGVCFECAELSPRAHIIVSARRPWLNFSSLDLSKESGPTVGIVLATKRQLQPKQHHQHHYKLGMHREKSELKKPTIFTGEMTSKMHAVLNELNRSLKCIRFTKFKEILADQDLYI